MTCDFSRKAYTLKGKGFDPWAWGGNVYYIVRLYNNQAAVMLKIEDSFWKV